MAFIPVKSLDGASDPFEYLLLTDNEGVVLGQALVQTNGRLTKAGATATPEFIAQRTQAAETTSTKPIPVTRVDEVREFEVQSTATIAQTDVGSKVTLHTDGLRVTATKTNGTFLISATDGATTNSKVRGYFRR
ncbi:hypothetical protein [Paenibacillus lutrae]|uniref:Uncharacterized protein n=1 Tax=Paenibacillus lutrae TaxID=2078573 RepID=A0A7X3JZR0_9BACL|nr:hypothetical protein [Paenibacillus lutrae]MVP00353.1 hypothetical protein [Paenibacillus lutrae]